MGDDKVPFLKEDYSCLSCFNCMVACQEDAISIVRPYRVKDGFWKTDPENLPLKMPLAPKDDKGGPSEYTPVEQAILERRSIRNFKDKPVPDTLIRRVLEAGRFAPTPGNAQQMKFIVVTDQALFDEMDEVIAQEVGKMHFGYIDDEMVKAFEPMVADNPTPPADPRMIIGGLGPIARKEVKASLGAPAAILIAGDVRGIGDPKLPYGICGQNMCLAANSLGIGSCWLGFFGMLDTNMEIKKKLGLESPYHLMGGVVLGYPKFKQTGMVPRDYRPVTWFRSGWENPEIET